MKFRAIEKTFVKVQGEFMLFEKGAIIESERRQIEGFEQVFDELDINRDGKVDKKDKSLAGKTLVKKSKKSKKKLKKRK